MPGHIAYIKNPSLWSAFIRSAPRVRRKRVKGPLLLHSWPIFLFDWSPFRIHSFDLRQKRSHRKKGSFMQWITGRPPMDSSNSMNEGRSMRKAGFLYEDSNKKEKGQTISYWRIWLNEEELFMWSHFTTIWNARNFDWWKPVHEDSPFSYVQFPSFGKHPVSHQMNISLSLSCSLYVVWKLLQGSNE